MTGSSVRRSRGACGAIGAAGRDVVEPRGDVGVGVEAEHGVGLGQRLGQLVAVALGQAADRDDLLAGVGGGQHGVDRVLLGRVDEAAGVDQHDVGVVARRRSAQPPAPSRPASSSESTSLRAQPRVTSATRAGGLVTRLAGYPRARDRRRRRGRPARPGRPPLASRACPLVVRRARTADVPAIKAIVDIYAGSGRKLLAKELVTLYEDVQDFLVAELDGDGRRLRRAARAVGRPRRDPHAGRAPRPRAAQRIGALVLDALIDTARELGLSRLFALTFHTDFFARHGFVEIEGTPVDPDTYDALRRSYDPGVAEFLGLEYVKPNTLGNTRMLLELCNSRHARACLRPQVRRRGLASPAKGVMRHGHAPAGRARVHAVGAVHVRIPDGTAERVRRPAPQVRARAACACSRCSTRVGTAASELVRQPSRLTRVVAYASSGQR